MKIATVFHGKKFMVVVSSENTVQELKQEIMRIWTALSPTSGRLTAPLNVVQTSTGCTLYDGYTVGSVLGDNDEVYATSEVEESARASFSVRHPYPPSPWRWPYFGYSNMSGFTPMSSPMMPTLLPHMSQVPCNAGSLSTSRPHTRAASTSPLLQINTPNQALFQSPHTRSVSMQYPSPSPSPSPPPEREESECVDGTSGTQPSEESNVDVLYEPEQRDPVVNISGVGAVSSMSEGMASSTPELNIDASDIPQSLVLLSPGSSKRSNKVSSKGSKNSPLIKKKMNKEKLKSPERQATAASEHLPSTITTHRPRRVASEMASFKMHEMLASPITKFVLTKYATTKKRTLPVSSSSDIEEEPVAKRQKIMRNYPVSPSFHSSGSLKSLSKTESVLESETIEHYVPKAVHQKRNTKKKEQKARMISPKHTSDADASNSVQRVFDVPHQVSSQQPSKENSEASSPSPAAAESGGNRSDSDNRTEEIAADSVEGEGTSLASNDLPKVHQKRYTKKKEQKARMISPKHTSDEDASNSVQRVFNVPHQVSSQQLSKENSEISSPSPAAAESGGNRSDSVNHTEVIAADSVEGEGTSLASNNLPKDGSIMCIEETQKSQIECRSLSPEIPFTGSAETTSSQEQKTCAHITCNTCTINNDENKHPHSDELDTKKVFSDIEDNVGDLNTNRTPSDTEDNVADLNTNRTSSDMENNHADLRTNKTSSEIEDNHADLNANKTSSDIEDDIGDLDANKAACDVEVSSHASIDSLPDASSSTTANIKKSERHCNAKGLPLSDTTSSLCDTDTMEKHSGSHKKKKKKKKKKDKHQKYEELERSFLEKLPHTSKQSHLSPKPLMPPPSGKPTASSPWSPRTISTKKTPKHSDHPDFIFTATETEHSSDDSSDGEITTGHPHLKKPRKPSLLSALAKHGKKKRLSTSIHSHQSIPQSCSTKRHFSSEAGVRMFSLTNNHKGTPRRVKSHALSPVVSKRSASKGHTKELSALHALEEQDIVAGDVPTVSDVLKDGSLWEN